MQLEIASTTHLTKLSLCVFIEKPTVVTVFTSSQTVKPVPYTDILSCNIKWFKKRRKEKKENNKKQNKTENCLCKPCTVSILDFYDSGAVRAWGHEFNPRYLHKKPNAVMFACNLSTWKAKTGESLGLLAIQTSLGEMLCQNPRWMNGPRGWIPRLFLASTWMCVLMHIYMYGTCINPHTYTQTKIVFYFLLVRNPPQPVLIA